MPTRCPHGIFLPQNPKYGAMDVCIRCKEMNNNIFQSSVGVGSYEVIKKEKVIGAGLDDYTFPSFEEWLDDKYNDERILDFVPSLTEEELRSEKSVYKAEYRNWQEELELDDEEPVEED